MLNYFWRILLGFELICGTFGYALADVGQNDGNGLLDIAIVADGYGAQEQSNFEADANRIISTFLNFDPYRRRANQLRFHLVPRSGPALCTLSQGRLAYCDYTVFQSIAKSAGIPFEALYVLVNTPVYSGSAAGYGAMMGSGYNGPLAGEMFVHELGGHGIASLVDEYPADLPYIFLPRLAEARGAVYNCYFGSLPAIDWKNFDGSYFSGCQFSSGYRLDYCSVMFDLKCSSFNSISQAIINRKIDYFTGPQQLPPAPIAIKFNGIKDGDNLPVDLGSDTNPGYISLSIDDGKGLFNNLRDDAFVDLIVTNSERTVRLESVPTSIYNSYEYHFRLKPNTFGTTGFGIFRGTVTLTASTVDFFGNKYTSSVAVNIVETLTTSTTTSSTTYPTTTFVGTTLPSTTTTTWFSSTSTTNNTSTTVLDGNRRGRDGGPSSTTTSTHSVPSSSTSTSTASTLGTTTTTDPNSVRRGRG